jgi:hypothetical protein
MKYPNATAQPKDKLLCYATALPVALISFRLFSYQCELTPFYVFAYQFADWPRLAAIHWIVANEVPIFPVSHKRQKATRALHRMAFARLSP